MKDPTTRKILRQLDRVLHLATALFQDETKATQWLDESNDIFFGWSPTEMIIGGRGDSVIQKLEEWIGEEAPRY